MNNALLSGISGLQAHQQMLDVAGNNLANINTTAFKGSRVTFAEQLSQTLQQAGAPSATVGGTNPMQIGSGVEVASVDRNMTEGALMNTGQPLDMAIDGSGYFVLNDGKKDVYTRVGNFAVDSKFYLVDPATGNRVQRIGSEGVADGFQSPSSNNIRIPYDVALPAKQTEAVTYTGNLSAEEIAATTNQLISSIQYTQSGAAASSQTLLSGLDQSDALTDSSVILITGTRRDGSAVNASFDVKVTPTANELTSGTQYTVGGVAATSASKLSDLEQGSGLTAGDTFTIVGTDSNGTAVNATYTYATDETLGDLLATINGAYSGATASISGGKIVLTDTIAGLTKTTLDINYAGAGSFTLPAAFTQAVVGSDGSTMGELTAAITAAFANPSDATDQWSTADIANGAIRLTDTQSGYSQTDLNLTCTNGTIDFPAYFQMVAAGGEASRNTNIEIYDSQGNSHVMSAAFVRTDTPNTWDMVVTSLSGDVSLQDRRIKGITFNADGSFGGIAGGAPAEFNMTFLQDPTNVRTVSVNMGTVGQFDGLTQFGGSSTVAPGTQDGYAAGWLNSVSVTNEGVLTGVFTNGARRDLAALRIATFQNPAGLDSLGGNFFTVSANSGDPVATKALSGSAGGVRGGSLEKSNVDVATEFVNLIQAQNGFQANARTIKAANDMLQVLTNLTQ
ncbi:MAG: flagellar hook-basal body complex protein [Planctomycetota bacterium]|nr:flagellar hook-basal body complex protein [Planctomycetota bacterium]